MASNEWVNKRIAVLGYGVEGRSSVNYFLRHGAKIEVHDQKPLQSLLPESVKLHQNQGVNFKVEQDAFQGLETYDLVMRTPTFPPHHPVLQNLDRAKISSQTNIFLNRWRDQTIGVSGTKGKGTVATLVAHLLQKSGKPILLGGNIGVPLLEIMDQMTPAHLAVAELSSFQLWDVTTSPHLAVLTMVTPEHLEQHGDVNNYLQAKQNLITYQQPTDNLVALADYPYTTKIIRNGRARQWLVSRHQGASGAYISDDQLVFLANQPDTSLASLADTVLRGAHNAENLAAALVVTELCGVDLGQVKSWLQDYRPLPHRLERVGQADHLAFYDDSIATTPESAIAGIQSFSESLVVILGGVNKGAEWGGVAQALTQPNVCAAVLVGDEAPRISHAITEVGVTIPTLIQPANYDEAIAWAATQLPADKPGVILLSPGAKSFDQFQDYRDRGQKFAEATQRFMSQNHPNM